MISIAALDFFFPLAKVAALSAVVLERAEDLSGVPGVGVVGALAAKSSKAVPEDEPELIRLAQKGSREAFQELFNRYKNRIFSIAYDRLKSREDAEDITQETFVKAYFSLKNFRGEASMNTWLCRIVYNLCIDQRRKITRRGGEASEFDETADNGSFAAEIQVRGNPQEVLARKERVIKIQEALKKLSDDHRQVVMLREIDGLSYEDIADVLKISQGTVMSRLFYARKKLQEVLREFAPVVAKR